MEEGFNKFQQLVMASQNQQKISREGQEYLNSIWLDIQQTIPEFFVLREREDLLFSEVEIDQIFYIENEQYCKESKNQYFHIINQKREKVFGDPVVQV